MKDDGMEIARLAKVAADEIITAMPAFRDASPIQRGMLPHQLLRTKNSGAAKLKSVISSDASFGDLRGTGWLLNGNMGGRLIDEHDLPILLIDKALDGASVESFVEEARAFAASRTSGIEEFMPLTGVKLSETVSLGPGIDLIPWSDVPDSTQKEAFGGDLSAEEIMATPRMPSFRNMASAAIRTRSNECQVLFSSHEEAQPSMSGAESAFASSRELTSDVVGCITAQKASPVAAVGGWSQFERKVANEFSVGGYNWFAEFFDLALHIASHKPVSVDGKSIADLFQNLRNFNSSEKSVLRTGLARLNQAIRERNVIDKAIDLGIALEVFLLNDQYQGEMRYRLSIRGATFLGGKKPHQSKTLNLLKEAYNLRSKAVHGGNLTLKKSEREPQTILEETTEVCAGIARKLIENGSFPNWETEYVIGGGE